MVNKKNSLFATQIQGIKKVYILQILAFIKVYFKYIAGTIIVFEILSIIAELIGRCLAYV